MARTWNYLIVHHSAGNQKETVASIRNYHVNHNKWSDIGYHFVIEVDSNGRGHLKRGRSDARDGAHAGVVKYNREGLGLCVVGNYDTMRMSEVLFKDVTGAVLHICKLYNISPKNVLGHKDIKATACPGRYFPLSRLKTEAMLRLV